MDDNLPTRKLVFTFSVDELNQIKPQNIVYRLNDKSQPHQNLKNQQMLQKNQRTPILAEHFWIHTRLQCCLSFRRDNVYPNGNHFVTVVGRCSICSSHFKGTITNVPPENAK